MIKTHLLFVSLLLLFVSCKKDEKNQDTNLQAVSYMNVAYGNDPQQKLDVYLPGGRVTDSTKVVVMIHGGAWSEGDKTDFDTYVPVLQQRLPDYAIINMNYRLATASANAFPAQENDMKSVINFILQKKGEYHISDKIVLLGASSGAHMALLQAYKNSTPKIEAVVDYFGPCDMVNLYQQSIASAQFGLQILLSGTPTTNPTMYYQSSPIVFTDAQDPPTIIFHGMADAIVNVSQSTTLKQNLQGYGVPNELYTYAGLGHETWPPATMDDTFNKAVAFVKAHVH